jgi:DNA-binding response OmpR family regulator
MELKVLALGRKSVICRVSNALAEINVSITEQNNNSDAIKLLRKERFDLSLIDGQLENLKSTCDRINWQCRVPIVVITNNNETDWRILKTMDIDGFIPVEAGNSEILAYFNSIARRYNVGPYYSSTTPAKLNKG